VRAINKYVCVCVCCYVTIQEQLGPPGSQRLWHRKKKGKQMVWKCGANWAAVRSGALPAA